MLSYSLLFRKKSISSSSTTTMETPKPPRSIVSEPLMGLKTLADISSLDSPRNLNCVKRNLVACRSTCPPLEDKFSVADTENDVVEDVEEEEEDDDDEDNSCWATYGRRRPSRRRFPPPIPLLARTGNLTCHMPWVLKRVYKDDGRLVLWEVRVKHHEYFRARRENGRLTLQLVELDEQSPLFNSGPRISHEEDDRDHHTKLSSSPSTSTSLPLSWEEDEGCANGKNPGKNIEFETDQSINFEKNLDVARSSPTLPMTAITMLSSSMPESLCGKGWSLQHQLQISGAPLVRGY